MVVIFPEIFAKGRCRCCVAGAVDRGVYLGDKEVQELQPDPSLLQCPALRGVRVAWLVVPCH